MEDDLTRLKHIHDAIKEILDFTKAMDLDSFIQSRLTQYAVIHLFEICGEAAVLLKC